MNTKYEEGLLRFDRMNENAWCFDMGYQIIYMETGMTVGIRLMDRFQRAELLGTPDSGLVVSSGKRGKQWQYQLDPNDCYPARMAVETVDRLIQQAVLSQENDSYSPSEDSDDISDLPF